MTDSYSDLLEKAFSLHKTGHLEEAQIIYEKFIEIFPTNPDALNLYANLLTLKKEYDKALEYQNKVYELTKLEDIKVDIAKIYYFKNEIENAITTLNQIKNKTEKILEFEASLYIKINNREKAIETYKLILEINKNSYNSLYNISILYTELNLEKEAIKFGEKALKINENDLQLVLLLAQLYEKTNQLNKTIPLLEKAFILSNNNEMICLKIALISSIQKDFLKAITYYEKCLKINENNITALVNIPLLLIKVKQYEKALKFCFKAHKIASNNFEVHHSFYDVYKEMLEWGKCIEHSKKMIEINPNNEIGYSCLAEAYYESVDYNIALTYFNKALEISPDDADFLYNKACCLYLLEKDEEAILVLKKILEINPEYYHALKLIVNIHFVGKKYKEGITDYHKIMEPRIMYKLNKKEPNDADKFYQYYEKHWNKEDLSNKTLFIYNNAGYGDYIMFSRYIPIVAKIAKKVIVEADKNLFELYKNSFRNVEIVLEKNEKFEGYDYSTTCMSLLYSTNLDFNNIPFSKGWLKSNEELTKKYSKLDMFKTSKKKIGIFWQGNLNILKNRKIKIEQLIPILENKNFEFYSLDITDKDEKTTEILNNYNVQDLSKYIKTFNDTASMIENLDLIITIDSSIVHLAGALGKQTLLMLPNNAEWRWFRDTETTSWYNSVKIFKQIKQNNWDNVINDIKKELQEL